MTRRPRGSTARIGAWALAGSLAGFYVLPVSGCASTGFDGRVFRNGEVAFRVGQPPNSWREIESSHSLVTFRDDSAGATIALNGRCGKDGDDVPLKSLTHHLFIHFTDRDVLEQEVFTLDGRDALRTRVVAELDGVPKEFTVVVLKKDGCVYDFVHIATASAPNGSRTRFLSFVEGFATLEE